MEFGLALVFGSFTFGAPPERPREYEDRWFARDKAYHFAASAVIQGVGHSLMRANGSGFRDAARTAGVLTFSAGLGKELWDRSQGRPFSWKDLAADAVGGGTGAVVIRQLDR